MMSDAGHNYDEMKKRVSNTLSKLMVAEFKLLKSRNSVTANLEANQLKLEKALAKKESMRSIKSITWYNTSCERIKHATDQQKVCNLLKMVKDYEAKLQANYEHINRLRKWVQEGQENLRNINQKLRQVQEKKTLYYGKWTSI